VCSTKSSVSGRRAWSSIRCPRCGFWPANLGPAGVGKSALATQFAVTAAERGERVAMYLFDEGLEMFCRRVAGIGTDVERYLKSGRLTLTSVVECHQVHTEIRAR
jgi:KaiC/GvpD/RAD55 family RecA-like ATPase